ncbi:hypothetical protein RhiLY_09444 [Ceratobasidium sp. AG-Ba]|nr:hypothetical protein RhiLY_09444 [Ceratobasidium sp. AG-Ba]
MYSQRVVRLYTIHTVRRVGVITESEPPGKSGSTIDTSIAFDQAAECHRHSLIDPNRGEQIEAAIIPSILVSMGNSGIYLWQNGRDIPTSRIRAHTTEDDIILASFDTSQRAIERFIQEPSLNGYVHYRSADKLYIKDRTRRVC